MEHRAIFDFHFDFDLSQEKTFPKLSFGSIQNSCCPVTYAVPSTREIIAQVF